MKSLFLSIFLFFHQFSTANEITIDLAIECTRDLQKVLYVTEFVGEYPVTIVSLESAEIVEYFTPSGRSLLVGINDQTYFTKTSQQKHDGSAIIFNLDGIPQFISYFPRSSASYLVDYKEVQVLRNGDLHIPHPVIKSETILVNRSQIQKSELELRNALSEEQSVYFRNSLSSTLDVLREGAEFAKFIGEDVQLEKLDAIDEKCF